MEWKGSQEGLSHCSPGDRSPAQLWPLSCSDRCPLTQLCGFSQVTTPRCLVPGTDTGPHGPSSQGLGPGFGVRLPLLSFSHSLQPALWLPGLSTPVSFGRLPTTHRPGFGEEESHRVSGMCCRPRCLLWVPFPQQGPWPALGDQTPQRCVGFQASAERCCVLEASHPRPCSGRGSFLPLPAPGLRCLGARGRLACLCACVSSVRGASWWAAHWRELCLQLAPECAGDPTLQAGAGSLPSAPSAPPVPHLPAPFP